MYSSSSYAHLECDECGGCDGRRQVSADCAPHSLGSPGSARGCPEPSPRQRDFVMSTSEKMTPVAPHSEFAQVIGCGRCSIAGDRHLLRDDAENVPQPGYVGSGYSVSRVLLVGQNPGTPKTLAREDLPYTAALRALRDDPSPAQYEALDSLLEAFIPRWPVHGSYFPLAECGLSLRDIAYCNIVRCRTTDDKSPGRATIANCTSTHFARCLAFLEPRVVVFIGKWAAEHGAGPVQRAGIPFAFMNRQRSLSSEGRAANRAEVIALVRGVVGDITRREGTPR